MHQRAEMPGQSITAGPDATYGDLVKLARAKLSAAMSLPDHRFATADDAREELQGYLSFVQLAGRHIELLTGLVGGAAEDVRMLGRDLAAREVRESAESSTWNSAAIVLGAAHDLVTSHLDSGLAARTPDAEALLTPARILAASRQTIEMVAAAATVRSRLTRMLSALERGSSGNGRRSDDLVLSARRAERLIHLQGRAAMWDLHRLGIDGGSPALESLAFPITTSAAPSPGFESALSALRTLRQFSYDQARGRASASPASLRDLTRLGELVSDPGVDWLPPTSESGLARVQRACVIDALATAHERWELAGRKLTTVIQGVTQAPGRYAETVRWLEERALQEPSTRRAVTSALPALAGEASRTVLRMAGTGSLLTRQRVPMHLHAAWARIPFEDVQALMGSFDAAGNASRAVAEGVNQLSAHADRRDPQPALSNRRLFGPRRERGRAR
jgi:hypothetical protein